MEDRIEQARAEERRQDLVRVLRLVEYVGPRREVEKLVARSIHGEREFGGESSIWGVSRTGALSAMHNQAIPRLRPIPVKVRATTLGTFPDVLQAAVMEQALRGEPDEKDLRIQALEAQVKALKAQERAWSYTNQLDHYQKAARLQGAAQYGDIAQAITNQSLGLADPSLLDRLKSLVAPKTK